MTDNSNRCALCGCEAELTLHHLVPQVKCHNKYRSAKDDPSNHIMICRQCHDQIHVLWSENELRDSYSTLEQLKSAAEMQKFIAWKQKHPEFSGHSKMSNMRKAKRGRH